MGENTRQNILEAGKKEFLENGFKEASLRTIAKSAGVTTGAFYGYYKNKAALFRELVAEAADTTMNNFKKIQKEFSNMPDDAQIKHMGEISSSGMTWMAEYIFDHYDEFKLIVCCAEGTEYENYIDQFVEIEVEATIQFIEMLRSSGHLVREIDHQFCHMVASGLFNGFFEIVMHDMEKERAMHYADDLKEFYTAGWYQLLGLK